MLENERKWTMTRGKRRKERRWTASFLFFLCGMVVGVCVAGSGRCEGGWE